MPDRLSAPRVATATMHISALEPLGFSPDVALVVGADNAVLSLRLNSTNDFFEAWEGVPFGAVGFVPVRVQDPPEASADTAVSVDQAGLWTPIYPDGPLGLWTPIRNGRGPVGALHWSPGAAQKRRKKRPLWRKIGSGKGPIGSAGALGAGQDGAADPLLAIHIAATSQTRRGSRIKATVTLRKMDAGSSQFDVIDTAETDITMDQSPLSAAASLKAVRTVSEFREGLNAGLGLSTAERKLVVDQAIYLVRDVYAHLPLKRAIHSIDPVQSLLSLKQRIEELSTVDFHSDLLRIFTQLRDLHTNLIMPTPYGTHVAFLGVLVERFFQDGVPRYLVSKIYSGLVTDAALQVGVEITHWNGTPIDAAVARNADREAGSNQPSRMARGLETLTLRSLSASLPPESDWVDLTFIHNGSVQQARLPWLVFDNAREALAEPSDPVTLFGVRANSFNFNMGLDSRQETFRDMKKQLFNSAAVELAEMAADHQGSLQEFNATFEAWAGDDRAGQPAEVSHTALPTLRPDEISARLMRDAQGTTYGYLRLWTFLMRDRDIQGFLVEVMKFLDEDMPPEGLIIDVRGNGGGYIIAAEFLLQLLTWRQITPEPAQFVATQSTLDFVEAADEMAAWRPSLQQAVRTGALYSKGVPISSPELVNSVGQIYFGPIVLITDAYCYSACDMFAAGFQDHEIGTILGVDPQTGAGGANVVTQGSLVQSWPGGKFEPLPGNIGMRVSLRRTMRVGAQAGDPVEDLGVEPDVLHQMTRRDLLEGNRDLLDSAMAILRAQIPRQMDMSFAVEDDGFTIQLKTWNIDRIDVFVAGRHLAFGTPDTDGNTTFDIAAASAGLIEVIGYSSENIVAKRQLSVS